MTLCVRSLGRLRWFSLVASLVGLLAPVTAAPAQTRWSIDTKASLAWWQVSPHLNHLWATTCPQEPSWQPGDERSAGWDYKVKKAPKYYHSNIVDTIDVPLYPRPVGMAQPICARAVSGEIVASDTAGWQGVRGLISVRADAFFTGLAMRDEDAKPAVFQANRYAEIGFRVDSLIDGQRGDTV